MADRARDLLERDAWLDALRVSLDARSPLPALVLEGRPGAGKTAILDAACVAARHGGVEVLRASARLVEPQWSLAVVRQLFGPAGEMRPLFEAASIGGDAPQVVESAAAVVDDVNPRYLRPFAGRPMLVAVDDLHLSDPDSLAWIAFYARQLHGGPMWFIGTAVLPAFRTERGPLESLLAEPSVEVHLLRPLGVNSVRRMVRDRCGSVDGVLVHAVHDYTGGNPFLVVSLLDSLGRDDPIIDPESLSGVAPSAVWRSILARTAGLPRDALAVLEAVAVLGEAEIGLVGELSGLGSRRASELADALTQVHLFRPGRPLRFTHPIERMTVCGQMPTTELGRAHRRAAQLLTARGADTESITYHLLRTEPAEDPWMADQLHRVGRRYLAQNQPELAARYLPGPSPRPPPADARGSVVASLRRPRCRRASPRPSITSKRRSISALTPENSLNRRSTTSRTTPWVRWSPESGAVLDLLRIQPLDVPPELRLRLEVVRASTDPSGADAFGVVSTVEGLLDTRGSVHTRWEGAALCHVAHFYSCDPARATAERVASLAREGIDAQGSSASAPSGLPAAGRALAALVWTGRFDIADRLGRSIQALARADGYEPALTEVSTALATSMFLQGALLDAETESRQIMGGQPSQPRARAVLVAALREQGMVAEAETILTGALRSAGLCNLEQLALLEQRARFSLAQGQTREALEDLGDAEVWAETHGIRNPAVTTWRATTALALLGDRSPGGGPGGGRGEPGVGARVRANSADRDGAANAGRGRRSGAPDRASERSPRVARGVGASLMRAWTSVELGEALSATADSKPPGWRCGEVRTWPSGRRRSLWPSGRPASCERRVAGLVAWPSSAQPPSPRPSDGWPSWRPTDRATPASPPHCSSAKRRSRGTSHAWTRSSESAPGRSSASSTPFRARRAPRHRRSQAIAPPRLLDHDGLRMPGLIRRSATCTTRHGFLVTATGSGSRPYGVPTAGTARRGDDPARPLSGSYPAAGR